MHLLLLLQHQLRASSGACARFADSEVSTGLFQGALEMDSFSGQPGGGEAARGNSLSGRTTRVCLLQSKLEVCEGIASVLSKELATSCQRIQDHRGVDQDMICALELKVKGHGGRGFKGSGGTGELNKDAALVRLEEQLRSTEHASYDGTFLWKITEVHQKFYEAACGKVCSFHSPAFYTSRYGYKLCMKIFLNGEGRATGTHVSLFIALLRGGYDALLQWPFPHKITLMLLSQNPREHLLNTIHPEATSKAFQRPTTETNEACGFPWFVSLTKLQSPTYAYIREGALFLKCIIEDSS
uniref:TNF receptor associated factor 1 n=1 Tax=Varanus komodoensis TaxID=61221 RepID=A0A8D2J1S8_VARKO